MTREEIGKILKKLRLDAGLTQKQVGEALGRKQQVIGHWETGYSQPDANTLFMLCDIYKADVNDAFGFSPTTWRTAILPVKKRRIPLLGNIAAGEPMYAEEDLESYVLADEDIKCDFALRVCGDSMVNARIHDGDIVFIRKQPDVSNGEIAAVLIDDTATLKRVHKIKGGLMLTSENPKYAPMYYTAENSDALRIIGKAVAFQSDL